MLIRLLFGAGAALSLVIAGAVVAGLILLAIWLGDLWPLVPIALFALSLVLFLIHKAKEWSARSEAEARENERLAKVNEIQERQIEANRLAEEQELWKAVTLWTNIVHENKTKWDREFDGLSVGGAKSWWIEAVNYHKGRWDKEAAGIALRVTAIQSDQAQDLDVLGRVNN